jgi:hypothetical protein
MKTPTVAEYNQLGSTGISDDIDYLFWALRSNSYAQPAGTISQVTGADLTTVAVKSNPMFNGKFTFENRTDEKYYKFPLPANLVARGRGGTKREVFELISNQAWIGSYVGAKFSTTPTTLTTLGTNITTTEELILRKAESIENAESGAVAVITEGELDPIPGTPSIISGKMPIYWVEVFIPKSGAGLGNLTND